MRDRIEALGDILLAAAHADHHVEAQEIDKIEEILTSIWREDASAEAVVKRVADLKPGEADAAELEQLAARMKALEPKHALPSDLMQRLADFDPGRFDIDEAVGPFLHEPVEVKRRLLELAVSVHEADGELDFAEDTFIRELGFKLGLDLSQFGDLLLEFLPGGGSPSTSRKPPTESSTPDDAVPADDVVAGVPDAPSTDLVVPTGNGAAPGGPKRKAPGAALRALAAKAAKVVKKAPAKKKAAKKKAAKKKAPATKKAPAAKKKAAKKKAAKKKAAKKKAPAKKKVAKKAAKKKKR